WAGGYTIQTLPIQFSEPKKGIARHTPARPIVSTENGFRQRRHPGVVTIIGRIKRREDVNDHVCFCSEMDDRPTAHAVPHDDNDRAGVVLPYCGEEQHGISDELVILARSSLG